MNDDRSAMHTRPSLLVRVRDAADAGAWGAFVDIYAPVVYGFGRRRGLQDADAADLTQDVMGEVVRSIRAFEYQPARGRFRDWLLLIARRRLFRFFDRRAGAAKNTARPMPSIRPRTRPPTPTGTTRSARACSRSPLNEFSLTLSRRPGAHSKRVWLENRPASEAAAELSMKIQLVYKAKSRVSEAIDGRGRRDQRRFLVAGCD